MFPAEQGSADRFQRGYDQAVESGSPGKVEMLSVEHTLHCIHTVLEESLEILCLLCFIYTGLCVYIII